MPEDRKHIKTLRDALEQHPINVDYVSKWAEAQALQTNDAREVVTFLKKLFCRFGMPKALISDRVIMEYLVKLSKRCAFWSLNDDILKNTILKTNTMYPSRRYDVSVPALTKDHVE
nr:reverse transcriptase domain-containing protein [Tanacetum cinerariifolium]